MVIPIIMPMATPMPSSGGASGVDVEVKELELDTPEDHEWTLKLEEDFKLFGKNKFVIQAYLWKNSQIVASFRCTPKYHVVRHKASRVSKKYVKTLRGLYNK